MKSSRLKTAAKFSVLIESEAVQAASMVLRPGESSSGEKENEHPRAEQWLLVISGSGKASVGKRTIKLRPGSLVLIEKREPHLITNTGRERLVTLNFYSPPAYRHEGDVRRSVSRRKRRG